MDDSDEEVWKDFVPEEVLLKWTRPCEEMFEYLAENSPYDLLGICGWLRPSQLTFAAEWLGRCKNTPGVEKKLLRLLNHSSPMVREGALYGLYHLSDCDISRYDGVKKKLTEDTSLAVREIIRDLLA